MSEEEIKKIVKETFDENIMNNLDSSIVFKYVQILEKENKKYKEVINKTIKWVRDYMDEWDVYDEVYHDLNDLLILLEEVEHEKSNN